MDLTYIILVLPAVIFSLWASARVNNTFNKYSKQYTRRGLTGAQAARFVLDRNGLTNVRIEPISGNLTDHYDPSANVIRLSESVYGNTSTAAIGVACHETGHAIQHAVGYTPVKIRTAIVPVTNIGSKLSIPLILVGLLLSSMGDVFVNIAYLGCALFGICVVFQLVTLPTEFNASSRALKCIEADNILVGEELQGAKKTLSAAAMTYVAALAVTLMQFLRLLLLVSGSRRD
ncbi:MAG: zinc metallopeptidase [Bacillota bacterium]|nr:zinc metallopeptidase [Bacillota bacterium]